MERSRALRRLLIVLVVLVLVLLGLDLGARAVAQDELATRARQATGASTASASVRGFPFLARLLVAGDVADMEVRLGDVPAGQLRLQSVDVSLHDTTIDRAALFRDRQVRVGTIAAGTAVVTVSAAELSSAVGRTVVLPGGDLALVEVDGHRVPATVRIVGGHLLEVTAGGRSLLTSDLAASPLVPACDMVLAVGAARLTVSCHVAPVPARLVHSIAGG